MICFKNRMNGLQNNGFTLIEIITSLALFGVIITLILSTMNSSINIMSRVEKGVEIQQQAQFIFNFLEEKVMESTGLIYLEDRQGKSKMNSNEKIFIKKMIFKNKVDRLDKGYIFQLIKDPEYDFYNLKYGIGLSGSATVEVGNYIENIEVEPIPFDKKYNEADGILIRINFVFDKYSTKVENIFHYRNSSGV